MTVNPSSEYSLPTSRCSSTATTNRHREGRQRQRRSSSIARDIHSNQEISLNRNNRSSVSSPRKGKSVAGSQSQYHVSAKRSPSINRGTPREKKKQQKDEPSRKRSDPKRSKSKGRRESEGLHPKKKAPIRRTRSYEGINTTTNRGLVASTKQHSNRSFLNTQTLVDERGLPLTSEGCAPVASLRNCNSSHNADTADFDSMYVHNLQQEEYSRARRQHRPVRKRASSVGRLGSSRGLVGDCKRPPVEDDRKPPPKLRSKSSKRSSQKTHTADHILVPLNPEESLQFQKRNFGAEAKTFVQRLKELLLEFSCRGPSRNIFSIVLSDAELMDSCVSLFQVQKSFDNEGKRHAVDVAYHYCRGPNLKKIQQQPGLWSRIQANNMNRSQDGDGIYTFNNPLSSSHGISTTSGEQVHDVWMVVARLQGNKVSSSRQQWTSSCDSIERRENGMVILKSSAQFFPLVHFRSSLLAEAGRSTATIRQIQLIQDKLQRLLDNAFGIKDKHKAALSPDLGPVTKRPPQIDQPRVPLSLNEQLDAVSNPAAWEVASEVQAVVEEHIGVARATTDFHNPVFAVQSAVSAEELVVLVDNMFRTQRKFFDARKPSYIECGYHFIRFANLKKMQQKQGLWSIIQSRNINKSEDGDGIYTFNDPLGTRSRGNRGGFFDLRHDDDVWLLVARLQGNRQNTAGTPPSAHSTDAGRKWEEQVDALILGGRQSDDVVVLRTSAQFFPVLQFSAASMDAAGSGQDEVLEELQIVHQKLQALFDRFFNIGAIENGSALYWGPKKDFKEEILEYSAPNALDASKSIHGPSQQIFKVLSNNKKAAHDDCSICLDKLRSKQQVARLRTCGHEFHRVCLLEVLQRFKLCPICNTSVTPPPPQSCLQGLSPSGIMATTTEPRGFCKGCWAPAGSLLLSFFFPSGVQKAYHDRPGVKYASSNWKAFLPNNKQGFRLLRRLQYAFLNGLLFTVRTAHQLEADEGTVVSANVPLKTHPSIADDDADAYPDPAYFTMANNALDQCGVPEFTACYQSIEQELKGNNSDDSAIASPTRNLKPQPQFILSAEESEECTRVLRGLQEHQHGWMFKKALPATNGKPEKSMDFTVIEIKLAGHEYSRVEQFVEDVNLTFSNAMASHSKENPVHFMAKQLKKKFKKDIRMLGMSGLGPN